MKSEILKKSIEFATIAHEGQVRKTTGIAYINHPIAVLNRFEELVVPWLKSEEYHKNIIEILRCACVLHDVIEDTEYKNKTHFVENMGDSFLIGGIYESVVSLTDTSKELYPFANRKERKTIDAVRMHNENMHVQLIKICDIMCNVQDFVDQDPQYAIKFIEEKQKYAKFLTKLPEYFANYFTNFLSERMMIAKAKIGE